jgi:HAE1 family hydrophobic/amphiphilic exporter-1
VVLETLPSKQLNPEDLNRIYLRPAGAPAIAAQALQGGASQTLVPLSTIVKLSRKVAALTISHQGQLPAVTISFNLKEGVALGDVVNSIQALPLPATISGSFQGTAQVYKESLTGLTVLLFIAIAVIYMILGILYESFIHPITILSGLPSAGIGAMVTLLGTYWLRAYGVAPVSLNIYAFVGVIMLIGIVKKNAIMMIDFGIQFQKDGVTAEQAIVKGCLVRFRPIMMTTMCALMGCIPIAFNVIGNSNSRHSLGLVVVGGLMFSQLITLYITPVVYVYLDHLQVVLRRWTRDRRDDSAPRGPHLHGSDGEVVTVGGGAMAGVRAPRDD